MRGVDDRRQVVAQPVVGARGEDQRLRIGMRLDGLEQRLLGHRAEQAVGAVHRAVQVHRQRARRAPRRGEPTCGSCGRAAACRQAPAASGRSPCWRWRCRWSRRRSAALRRHALPSPAPARSRPSGRAANRACRPTPTGRRAAGCRRGTRGTRSPRGCPCRLSPDECPGVCQASLAMSTYSRSASKNGVRDFSWISACRMRNQPRGSASSRMKKPSIGLARECAHGLLVAGAVQEHVKIKLGAELVQGLHQCVGLPGLCALGTADAIDKHALQITIAASKCQRLVGAADATEAQAVRVLQTPRRRRQPLEQRPPQHRVGNDEQNVAVRSGHGSGERGALDGGSSSEAAIAQ